MKFRNFENAKYNTFKLVHKPLIRIWYLQIYIFIVDAPDKVSVNSDGPMPTTLYILKQTLLLFVSIHFLPSNFPR